MSKDGQMWGGRFQGSLDALFAEFQKRLPVDHVLAFADLRVNRAWSTAQISTMEKAQATCTDWPL